MKKMARTAGRIPPRRYWRSMVVKRRKNLGWGPCFVYGSYHSLLQQAHDQQPIRRR
jgi:hypothetical protein